MATAPAADAAALRERLAEAERSLAAFNARRTGADPATAVRCGRTPHLDWLVDPSRPGSPYYCRAVVRGRAPLPDDVFDALPAGVAAVELGPSSVDAGRALVARGFVPIAAPCYLGRRPPAAPLPLPPGIAVERVDPADVDRFLDLLEREGVPFPPERRAAKRGFYATDAFRCFVARGADGAPWGWATMHVDADAAFLGNAFVLPEHRRRGAHAALLAARLNDAAGLAAVYTDVEHGSPSHANVERAGFVLLTITSVWVREASAAAG